MRRPQKGEVVPGRKKGGFPENPNFYKISSIAPLPELIMTPGSSRVGSSSSLFLSSPEPRTVSESSNQLAVVSERSHRTNRIPQEPKRRKSEEGDPALFFNDVASVGSWIDGNDDWEPGTMSPLADPNSDPNSSLTVEGVVPRELQIPMVDPFSPSPHVLSKADLSYLAQQNRLLLKQAQVFNDERSI